MYTPKARNRAIDQSCWSRRRFIVNSNRTCGQQQSLPVFVLRSNLYHRRAKNCHVTPVT